MGITILPQTFTGKFDEMNQQLVKIANAQSTASGGIADAVNLANQATQSAEAKIVDIESRFNTLTSAQQGDSEVVDARKGEVSLRAKIDKIDTAHIAHLADTTPHEDYVLLKTGGTMTGDLEMGFSKWFKGPVLNLIRETKFGYGGSSYGCIQLGELSSEAPRKAIAIGIDPFTNPGGAFNGDEIALPNYVEFMQANSDNSNWIQDVLIMDNGILKTGPGKHALWHEGNLDYEEG